MNDSSPVSVMLVSRSIFKLSVATRILGKRPYKGSLFALNGKFF